MYLESVVWQNRLNEFSTSSLDLIECCVSPYFGDPIAMKKKNYFIYFSLKSSLWTHFVCICLDVDRLGNYIILNVLMLAWLFE